MEVKLEVGQAADPRGAAGSESPDKERAPSPGMLRDWWC